MSETLPVGDRWRVSERLNQLCPAHWDIVRLGDVADVMNGAPFASVSFNERGVGVPIIRIRDVGADDTATSFSGDFDSKYWVEPGDLLVGMDGDFRARIWRGRRALLNQRVCRVRFRGDPAMVAFWISCLQPYLDAVERVTSSVTVKHLSSKTIEELRLPAPPMDERRRIGARLGGARIRSRRAKHALDAVPALLDRLRQSILAAAFRGDLTADWREQNPDVEPASELLKRIRVERRRRWEEAELAKMTAKGRPPHDDRWKAKYVESEPVDASAVPELPSGWCWAAADELCARVPNGGTPPALEMTASHGDVPFIKVYNLTSTGRLDFSINPTFVSHGTHTGRLARSASVGPSVLLNIVGPPLGKVALVPAEFGEFNFNQAIVAFHLLDGFDARLLARWLQTPFCHRTYMDEQKATSGQFNISVSFCRRIPVPLVPAAEQLVLAARLEEALRGLRVLEKQCVDTRAQILSFDAAVLAAAIRGDLLSPHPDASPSR